MRFFLHCKQIQRDAILGSLDDSDDLGPKTYSQKYSQKYRQKYSQKLDLKANNETDYSVSQKINGLNNHTVYIITFTAIKAKQLRLIY